MILFALLFGSGFLTAMLLVFLVAPAIHRRIVWFTEKRLRATMPLSPQEVRAQKDMARALYAAENAKTEQALARERDKGIALLLQQAALTKEAGRLASDNDQLHQQIDEMSVEASDLRSRLRREESNISQLKTGLRISEQAHAEKQSDLDAFRQRIDKMAADADNLKIDLATRETEIESLRFRFNSLRTERDGLRGEIEAMTRRANDAEIRLGQEEHKVGRLEDKLGREIAGNADKQALIERRLAEVASLKEKLKAANATARETGRTPKRHAATKVAAATSGADIKSAPRPQSADGDAAHATAAPIETVPNPGATIAQMSEEARNRSVALSDRLLRSRSTSQDAALRQEIAAIAANMVALTALKEGDQSPILDLLSKADEQAHGERKNLADRSRELLSKPPA